MSFSQWVGKTVQRVETKEVHYYEDYSYQTTSAEWIYFTDETGVVVYTIIEESGSSHWPDQAVQCMDWMDRICQRCGTINPVPQENCRMGKEIKGARTEPHVFLGAAQ